MTESSYTAKLEFISGDNVSIDYISFYMTTAVEDHSWGAIKSYYR